MMLQAVAHDVKNKLAELAMRLLDRDIEAAALALDSADKLSQALLLDNPDQLTPQIESTCPADLVEEMTAVYSQLFPDKTVKGEVAQAPTLWYYDIGLMRLALSNAVHNACKHCATAVEIRALESNGYLLFEVRNDGEAFPASVLNASRDECVLVDANGKLTHGHSTGMGLLLSHKIVQAHVLEKNGVKRAGHLELGNEAVFSAVARLAVP